MVAMAAASNGGVSCSVAPERESTHALQKHFQPSEGRAAHLAEAERSQQGRSHVSMFLQMSTSAAQQLSSIRSILAAFVSGYSCQIDCHYV